MIRRHETQTGMDDIWSKIAAPLAPADIQWRQDGRPVQRDGKWFARFVAFIGANTVRERLDSVVPGEWDFRIELLPAAGDDDGELQVAFKGKLIILGTEREDVGMGRDYKAASSDTLKRCAVRFGIAHELYDYEQNWVQVDSDSKYAKPVEDPAVAYARKTGRRTGKVADTVVLEMPAVEGQQRQDPTMLSPTSSAPAGAPATTSEPECPKCGSRMWDNRLSKRNKRAPDFKCRDRGCDGVIWPPKDGEQSALPMTGGRTAPSPRSAPAHDPGPLVPENEDELPF